MSHTNSNSPHDHLHDALKTLFASIPHEDFPTVENWKIGYGPSMTGYARTPYWSPMDSHDFPPDGNNRATVLRFHYTPTGGMVDSRWVSHTNYISVRVGSSWDPKYNRDENGEINKSRPKDVSTPFSSSTKKYLIGGPLCDPVVTGNVDTAAKTVKTQFSRVRTGSILNHILEVLDANKTVDFTSDDYQEKLPSIDDLPADLFDENVERSSPIQSVSGIGDKTIKRFASRFGVYSNLRTAEWEDLSDLLPGYSHSPDLDEMDMIVTAITEHYQQLNQQPDWQGPVIDPEDFVEYPAGNPAESGSI